MIRILRISALGELVSADAFEQLFKLHIGASFTVDLKSSSDFFVDFRDCLTENPNNQIADPQLQLTFKKKVEAYDFFSPGFGAFICTPFFLKLRNLTGSNVRLLLLAHAPGAMIMEWVLAAPFLRPGDLIIAPSHSAAQEIAIISPALLPFIKIIPHPLHPLPVTGSKLPVAKIKHFVSLSRLHPSKLIHRQIEALALLQDRTGFKISMDIAGPQEDASGCKLNYARSLSALIERLDLGRSVTLTGPIYGDKAKADFLTHAHTLINLSVSLEESFGKSIVESLGCGVPVICTRWNGFPETAGPAGLFVPVISNGRGQPDINAAVLAEIMEKSLTSGTRPKAEICRQQARCFAPKKIVAQYRSVLTEAITLKNSGNSQNFKISSTPAFDQKGLLKQVAFLQIFSFAEVFKFYQHCFYKEIGVFRGQPESPESGYGDLTRGILTASLERSLGNFLRHVDTEKNTSAQEHPEESIAPARKTAATTGNRNFFAKLGDCTLTETDVRSQEICLYYCAANKEIEPLKSGLQRLLQHYPQTTNSTYLAAELKYLEKHFNEAYVLAERNLIIEPMTESDSLKLRQLAKICRKMGKPEKVIPHLEAWLVQFPDAPDAGPIWLDLCANAAASGNGYLTQAHNGFRNASRLLDDIPALQKLSQKLFMNFTA